MDDPSESESNPQPVGDSIEHSPTLEGAAEPKATPENTPKVEDTPVSVVNIHRAGAEITPPDVLSIGPIAPLEDPTPPKLPLIRRIPATRLIGVLLIVVGLMVGSGLALHGYNSSKHAALNDSATGASARLKQQSTSLSDLDKAIGTSGTVEKGTLTVNGQLQLTGSLVLQPSTLTGPAVTGEVYFDDATNTLAYYNGTGYVHVQGGGSSSFTNNVTNITNSTFVTNAAASGQAVNGTPGTLAVFGAGGSSLSDSLLKQSGTTLTTVAAALEGTSAGGFSVLTADASGATSNLTVQSGNSTTASSGTVTIDSGSGVVNGLTVDDFTFENDVNGFNNAPYGGTNAQSNAEAHGGTHSLAITLQANSWSALSSNDLTVIPGHEYRWSEWMRSSATSVSGDAIVYFRSINVTSPTVSFTDNSSGWTEVSGSFIDPTGNTQVDLSSVYKTILASPEVHYVDDITLTDLNTFTGLSVNVGTTNAQAVSIGNGNQVGDTIITGSTTGVKIKDTTGNIYISGQSVLLSGSGAAGNGVIVTPQGDNKTAFEVTNASGASAFAIDTTDNAVVLGNGGAAPSVPVIQGASAIGNNIIGANMVFDASNGTGVGGSGDFVFNTAAGQSNPQVTVDTTLGASYNATNGPMALSYTTGSQSDRLLVVSVDSAAVLNPSTATSVTYGGQAMTELTGLTDQEANGSIWYLVNPASGTNTISVTMTGTLSDVGIEGTTFYNVDQNNPIANYANGAPGFTSSTSTTLLGTNTGEGIYDAVMARADWGNSLVFGGGQQEIFNLGYYSNHSTGSFRQGEAGSTTMSESNAGTSNLNHVVMAINPEPNVTPDTLTQAMRITQSGTVGINLANGENAQNTISFGGSADRSIGVDQNLGTGAGHSLAITAGTGAVGDNNGGNLVMQGGQATGSGISGAVSILTGNAANLSGTITLQTGNSSTTSAGSVSVDSGSSVINGTTMANNTFEAGTENYGSHNGGTAQDSSQAHGGTFSLAYTQGVGGTWDVEQQNTFAVTPGHTYNVTAWIRAGANPQTISMLMHWNGPGTYTTLSNVSESSSAWTEISGNVTAPAGATAAAVYFTGPWETAGNVHYFDDVTVIDMSSSSTQALVSVGGTNAQAVTLGNANEIGATNIFGGSGINLNSGVGNIIMTSGGIVSKAESDTTTFYQIQNSSGGSLFTADTTGMTITINGSLTVTGDITVNGHFVSGGSVPTVAPPINCGTSPTATLTSGATDSAGSFTVATGSGSGTTCDTTITFNQPYASAPKTIILTPTVAISGTTISTDARVSAVSTNSFTVQLDVPAATSNYSYYYWVVQ